MHSLNGHGDMTPHEFGAMVLGATVEMRRDCNRRMIAHSVVGTEPDAAKFEAAARLFKAAERIARPYRMVA